MISENNAQIRDFVRRVPLFADLSNDRFDELAHGIRGISFDRGSVVFNQDEPASRFFVVVEGWIKVYRTTARGEEAVIGIFTRGQSFAEIAALAGDNYPAHAEAVTEARLAAIPIERVVTLIARQPDAALVMLASISRHVRQLVDEIEQIKGLTGIQRVAEFLIEQSPVSTGACTVRLPYEKTLIASKLGMKAESLSRVFQRLRRFGVSIKGDMAVINDVATLRDAVDQDRPSAVLR